MTPGAKRMLIGSMAAAGLVGLMAILDMAIGVPFARQIVLDVMFLISAALIAYMGFETYREMS